MDQAKEKARPARRDPRKAIYKPAGGAHHSLMRKILRDDRDDWDDDWGVDGDAERQTKALAGLALTLALALIGCYLVIHLRAVGNMQDCLLAQPDHCESPNGSS